MIAKLLTRAQLDMMCSELLYSGLELEEQCNAYITTAIKQ